MNFTLVRVGANNKSIVKQVNEFGVLEATFLHTSKIANLCEALDVLSESGYRVIVEAEDTTFIHRVNAPQILQEADGRGLGQFFGMGKKADGADQSVLERLKAKAGGAYNAMKDKYKDMTSDKFDDLVAERKAAGTYDTKASPSFRSAQASSAPQMAKGVGSGAGIDSSAPRRQSTVGKEGPQVASPAVKQIRRRVPSIISQVKNMLEVDKESYRRVMEELASYYTEKFGDTIQAKGLEIA